MEESYMSIKEFCERMQVSTSTVYRRIRSGEIPAVKFGRYWKIPRSVFGDLNLYPNNYYGLTNAAKRI
ncbi:MAG: helix-turn-helix domain-containing protein [Eubacterium sp.]|nr:helix-turn-helix domain-containing protein [Eubacterium sp.]